MKVVLPTSGNSLEAPLDSRFGRASRFIVYDTDTEDFEVVDNESNSAAAHGAGIQTSGMIGKLGVNAVITGSCGPNAFQALSAAEIEVYTTDASTVADALARFRAGELTASRSANVKGHWG